VLALRTVTYCTENEETPSEAKKNRLGVSEAASLHAVQGGRNRAGDQGGKPRGLMCSSATLAGFFDLSDASGPPWALLDLLLLFLDVLLLLVLLLVALHLADGRADLPLHALDAQLALVRQVVEVGVLLHRGQRRDLRAAQHRRLELGRLVAGQLDLAGGGVGKALLGAQVGLEAVGRDGGQVARVGVLGRREDREDRLAAHGLGGRLGLLPAGVVAVGHDQVPVVVAGDDDRLVRELGVQRLRHGLKVAAVEGGDRGVAHGLGHLGRPAVA